MDVLLLALRIAHVGGAALWVGGAVMFLRFVTPAIARAGPPAGVVMADLLAPHRLPRYFAVISTLTVGAGAILFWRDTGGLQPAVLASGSFRTFALGGAAGFLAWLFAVWLVPLAVGRLGEAAAAVRSVEGRPDIELLERLESAQAWLHRAGVALLVLLTTAIVAMAVARYIP